LRPFNYECPHTLDDALALLGDSARVARPLAGGTDLLVQLRSDRVQADLVVDVKRIPELNEVTVGVDGLVIGAAVPCCRIAEHVTVGAACPALVDAVSLIGGIQIRNRASLGGNLCSASPAADGVPPLIVHRAVCRIAGPRGAREVPVGRFCLAPAKTVLDKGELLVSIRLPSPRPGTGSQYQRFIPRTSMDIAVAGAAAYLELEEDRETIRDARVSLGGVAPTALALDQVCRDLVGRKAGDEAFAAAAVLAREAADPIDDIRGDARQRRHLAGVLTRRTLQGAFERAARAGAEP
jgi:xanthine dehydrogenase FAD-binding subunit